jgi:thiol-disulfide isomerase/thioredoxin
VVLLAMVGVGAFLLVGPSGHTVQGGTRLEARTLRTSEGEAPLFGGGITVLNFWGEHCPPCRQEAPALSRVHRALRERGRVLGISVDSPDLRSARRVARDIGMTFPTAVLDRDLQDTFGVTVVPTTYVVDASGVVRKSFVGAVSESTLRQALAALD